MSRFVPTYCLLLASTLLGGTFLDAHWDQVIALATPLTPTETSAQTDQGTLVSGLGSEFSSDLYEGKLASLKIYRNPLPTAAGYR